jgi:hypothetical protein
MRIHRVKAFSEVKSLSGIYPSLDYVQFGCTDAEAEIIESHLWGDVTRWNGHVFQRCKECQSQIGVKVHFDAFLCLYVCLPRGTTVKAEILPCNQTIIKDI